MLPQARIGQIIVYRNETNKIIQAKIERSYYDEKENCWIYQIIQSNQNNFGEITLLNLKNEDIIMVLCD